MYTAKSFIGLTLFFAIGTVNAEQDESFHQHNSLATDDKLTISVVLDVTVARYPATIEFDARQSEAAAWTNRGGSWLADQPVLSLRYQSDRWQDDNGLTEVETGIELPLWRWGERSATRSLGQAFGLEADTSAVALRWEVAGKLRRVLWNIALAENEFSLAESALDATDRLTKVVERRHALGDVALGDVLLAKTVQLEAQSTMIDARAALLDAERAYRSLTSLDRRPRFVSEVKSGRHGVEESHPALALASAALLRAEARLDLTKRSAKAAPRILIGPRRERSTFGQDYEESVGITMTMPFGGSSHTQTTVAAAAREAASVRAAHLRLARDLELRVHEAAHELNVVRETLAAATQLETLADRQYGMGQSAYEKGELDLIDLLKLQSIAMAAKRQVSKLSIEKKQQTSFYNQAIGELP